MSATGRERLVIDNRLAELVRVEVWLARLFEAWGLSAKTAYAVDLVVNEAVTNVITHGYADDAAHAISLTLPDTPEAVEVEVEDDGRPFNPLEAPAMVRGEDLAHASIGGRGIHLMKSYSAAQDYRYVSGKNRLTLSVRKET